MKKLKTNFLVFSKNCIFFLLFILLFAGRQNFVISEEVQNKTAHQYYLDGLYYYADRSYNTSAEQFEALSKNYPYSEYTEKAIVLEAYTNYLDKEYAKIEGICEIYYKLYPDGKYSDYITYLHGMSYYALVGNELISSDNIEDSMEIFEKLLEKYPESKFVNPAKKKIEYLFKLKQLHDLTIANFFYNTEDYIAAMRRYTSMFNLYNTKLSPDIKKIAIIKNKNITKILQLETEENKYEKLLINDKK